MLIVWIGNISYYYQYCKVFKVFKKVCIYVKKYLTDPKPLFLHLNDLCLHVTHSKKC